MRGKFVQGSHKLFGEHVKFATGFALGKDATASSNTSLAYDSTAFTFALGKDETAIQEKPQEPVTGDIWLEEPEAPRKKASLGSKTKIKTKEHEQSGRKKTYVKDYRHK